MRKKDWDETWYVDDTNKRIKNKEDTIKNTTILETLSEKIYLNYVKEAKLIAGKASAKVFLMKCGNISFLFAFVSLLGLTVTLFPPQLLDPQPLSQLSLVMIGISCLLLVIALGYLKIPGINSAVKGILWVLFFVSLVVLAFSLFGRIGSGLVIAAAIIFLWLGCVLTTIKKDIEKQRI